MKKMQRAVMRTLIETCHTAKDADALIIKQYGFETVTEKIAFLLGMFDIEHPDNKDEQTYLKLLEKIISNADNYD